MKKLILLLILIIPLTGCLKLKQLRHYNKLMALKGLAENKEEQAAFVIEENERFEKLLASVKDKSIDEYKRKEDLIEKFGQPIAVRTIVSNTEELERWLYRYSVRFMDSEKVYIYFNNKDKVVKYRHVPAPEKSQETK